MLDLVHCKVLNHMGNEYFDAYLLSESSLFVFPFKIILKTCGTTTLLCAVPEILRIAKAYAGLTLIGDVFYSRRNYFLDQKQLEPHGSFQDEVKFLDKIFHGSAYILGNCNDDHWYLYLTDKDQYTENVGDSMPLPVVPAQRPVAGSSPDFTLEILMTDLAPAVRKQFYKDASATALSVSKGSGISDLIDGATIDPYLFEPMGYSMNGQLDDGYMTIHVTPQEYCSYASFETNIPPSKENPYPELLVKVLTVFKPQNFTLTLFAGNFPEQKFHQLLKELFSVKALDGYHRQSKIGYELNNNYELAYAHYATKSSACRKRKTLTEEASSSSSAKLAKAAT